MQNTIPPVATIVPTTHTIHGDTRTDNYRWLQDKTSADVIAYLDAENAYTKSVMEPTEALQKTLYDELLGRIQETDLSVPYPYGGWLYYTRTEEGKQYPIYCRKKGEEGDEQVTLDVNALAEGEKFMAVGAYAISDDGNLLAYTTDNTGFREYTLRIKNLVTGELLPDVIEKVDGVSWAADNKTLFYVTEDETKRPHEIYRYELAPSAPTSEGTRVGTLIYEEPDALYRCYAYRSRDKKLLFVISASSTTTELHYLELDSPTDALTVILPREEGHEYYAEHRDGLFYLRTNKDAPTFKLIATPVSAPEPLHWSDVLPYRPEVGLEDFDLFAGHLVASEQADGLPQLRVLDFATGTEHTIAFPEPTYALSGEANREFETTTFRFRYSSLVTPPSVFDYDLNTRERLLLKETPVLGGWDRSSYVTERLFATASDGTRIPISLVRHKDTPVDGSAAGVLYGYGSYGIIMPASFRSSVFSLLDRGMVYAIAHIRGGGEYGKPWHDAAKLMTKMNTFTDFIACADFLVEQKQVDRERLAIMGGSAGGLLMGAVVNLRPDLAKACVSYVPFVDVINTMLDDTLPLTVGEYLEWGNPNEPEAYAYMLSYSPYDQLEAKDYPTMLVKTSLNDSQVMYWEPAKYVAKLRTLKTDSNPLLLHCNMDAGHGGASGRYDALHEAAFDYAFLITQLGAGG
ncbi:S9 family peptidase [Armatimonas rosea]|uniref:Oligopeptidase B n=1 Tax=Armatimonas rosea TaxID=685828 RepID=A0A7W9STA5_ARMRO|nr:S9 family peptidase [Armatimonas rosea]MBB6052452.1 oligopeptidase B [Armatimonas rosea]